MTSIAASLIAKQYKIEEQSLSLHMMSARGVILKDPTRGIMPPMLDFYTFDENNDQRDYEAPVKTYTPLKRMQEKYKHLDLPKNFTIKEYIEIEQFLNDREYVKHT